MNAPTPITIARGDGIGPEIMDAVLRILDAAGANLAIEEIEIGESVFKSGVKSGMRQEAWDSIRRTKVFLKAPITTPQGGGYKSLNVSIRTALGLFANVRPCVSYYPYIQTNHPKMNVVIVRENEEDLYAGIEYRQTADVAESLKLISHAGSQRIIRYAFEYARRNNRKRVTAFVKDNIMKITDGLFHKTFLEIAKEYPTIEHDSYIVDIGAARLADTPERFDVIVTSNLYGDIISDIAAQITGSVGLGGSSNIGEHAAMFEAIHGSAPDIAGQNVANPSGLLLGAVMMLMHIGQWDVAERVHNAWLTTIEEGIHKHDIYREGVSKQRVGTKEFASAVIQHLNQRPQVLEPVDYSHHATATPFQMHHPVGPPEIGAKELIGVDVYIDWNKGKVADLVEQVQPLQTDDLSLEMITSRGVRVWPDGIDETFTVDHWRCRFRGKDGQATHASILKLLTQFEQAGFDFVKTEHLYTFDGEEAFSGAQG